MKIGRKTLNVIAIAALSVGTVFAQDTSSKPSNQAAVPQTQGEHANSHSSGKKVGKHVHGHHHRKTTKQTASTPTQDTTTKN